MLSVTYTPVIPQSQVDDPLVNPVMASQAQLRWVMAMLGSTPTRRCSSCGILLVGKVAHLCRVKNLFEQSVPTVLGELRCGHITSVSLGWAGVSCFGIVSGSCAVCYDGRGVRQQFKIGNPVLLLKLIFKKAFLKINPCIKCRFSAN